MEGEYSTGEITHGASGCLSSECRLERRAARHNAFRLEKLMPLQLPSSIISAYFDEAIDKQFPGEAERIAKAMVIGDRARETLILLSQIDNLHKEICIVLNDFEGRPVGFLKWLTIEQLILNVKMYVISWTTLIDMLAALINKVFNLSLATIDVNLDRILRNEHVVKSEIPAIFNKHRKIIDVQNVKRHRNEIVHRGRILDDEIQALYEKRNVLESNRYSPLTRNKISEDEYKEEQAKQTKMLFELASSKQATYGAHYTATLSMFTEMLASLARKIMADSGIIHPS
jgi:hypothetical protein